MTRRFFVAAVVILLALLGTILFVTLYGVPTSLTVLLKTQVINPAATQAAGVYNCQSGQQVSPPNWVYSVDPESFAANQAYGANSLSSNAFNNSAGSILQSPNWGSSPTKFFKPDNAAVLVLESTTCSRNMEAETFGPDGLVLIRYDAPTGRGLYADFNLNNAKGELRIGIITNAFNGSFNQAQQFPFYENTDLTATVPGYTSWSSESFTFGVQDTRLYAKFQGNEFMFFADYRTLLPGNTPLLGGKAAVLDQASGYGFRKVTVRHLADSVLLSDYAGKNLDPRDFGLSASQATGSITVGTRDLQLNSNPGFKVGDRIIVATGKETGITLRAGTNPGDRGNRGIGGTWPALSYPNAAARDSASRPPTNTYAWLEDDRLVYQWDGSTWRQTPDVNQYYYSSMVYPLALIARVTAVNGTTLRLDTSASVSASGATVQYDNTWNFNQLTRNRVVRRGDPYIDLDPQFVPIQVDYTPITPTGLTLTLPAGQYAVSNDIRLQDQPGITFQGQGTNQTILVSPNGTPSTTMQVAYSPSARVQNFKMVGSARKNGFTLSSNVTQTDIPQGRSYPGGIILTTSDDSTVEDIALVDTFFAVYVRGSQRVSVSRMSLTRTDGNQDYAGWAFWWSDATAGGSCTDCSFSAVELTNAFEAFKSIGVRFERIISVNGSLAMNAVGNFSIKDSTFTIKPNSLGWGFSKSNPVINVNTNILTGNCNANPPPTGYNLAQGGVIDNVTITHEGYINNLNDSLQGIVVNCWNPNVRVFNSRYNGLPYQAPSQTSGAIGVNSTGLDTTVDGFAGSGGLDPRDPSLGHVMLQDGSVSNCASGTIVKEINDRDSSTNALIDASCQAATPSPSPSPSSSPSPSPSASPTPLPTPTPTPSATPSPTPSPANQPPTISLQQKNYSTTAGLPFSFTFTVSDDQNSPTLTSNVSALVGAVLALISS